MSLNLETSDRARNLLRSDLRKSALERPHFARGLQLFATTYAHVRFRNILGQRRMQALDKESRGCSGYASSAQPAQLKVWTLP
jgi:hypothetical protein